MRNRLALLMMIMLSLLLITIKGASQTAINKWEAADSATIRLTLDSFPELPEAIKIYLTERGYTIPQVYGEVKPGNVIQGEFKQEGQTDWAVLSSKNFVSTILVFWNSETKKIDSLASRPDISYLQNMGDSIGYSRYIGKVDAKYMLDHFIAYGSGDPPPLDHDGINDGFARKGSSVHYYYKDFWYMLPGAD